MILFAPSLLVMLVGLVVYFVASGKAAEIGLVMFGAGLVACLIAAGGHVGMVRLGG